jgi:hypothetical protein
MEVPGRFSAACDHKYLLASPYNSSNAWNSPRNWAIIPSNITPTSRRETRAHCSASSRLYYFQNYEYHVSSAIPVNYPETLNTRIFSGTRSPCERIGGREKIEIFNPCFFDTIKSSAKLERYPAKIRLGGCSLSARIVQGKITRTSSLSGRATEPYRPVRRTLLLNRSSESKDKRT